MKRGFYVGKYRKFFSEWVGYADFNIACHTSLSIESNTSDVIQHGLDIVDVFSIQWCNTVECNNSLFFIIGLLDDRD